jgi:hypothetical protein
MHGRSCLSWQCSSSEGYKLDNDALSIGKFICTGLDLLHSSIMCPCPGWAVQHVRSTVSGPSTDHRNLNFP